MDGQGYPGPSIVSHHNFSFDKRRWLDVGPSGYHSTMKQYALQHVKAKSPGQAMIEYFVGLTVVALLISSLFILLLPEALATCFNNTFDSVHEDLFPSS
jgi:hypothetical protein